MFKNKILSLLVALIATTALWASNVITYTATEKLSGYNGSLNVGQTTFGSAITSHEFVNGIGTITCNGEITTIGHYAFYDCSGLTSITIPNSVTTIGSSAFYGCSGLTFIEIPNSVTSIGEDAFYYCSKLSSVIWNAKKCASSYYHYSSGMVDYLTAPCSPFHGSISNITSFTIGNEVECIPAHLCDGMSKLTSITIPNSVTTIGEDAFFGCSGLKKTNYTGTIADWCKIKFGDYIANPMYYSHNFYINDVKVKELVIPEGVDTIGNCAFAGCTSWTSVTIPNSVTMIGDYTFYNCSSLTSVTISNSVSTIGSYAFFGCSGLTSPVYNANCFAFMPISYKGAYTIPSGIKQISGHAFKDCKGLISITIPNSVTTIGDRAFYGCSGLKKTNYTGTIADWCKIQFSGATSNPINYSKNFFINDVEVKELVIPEGVDTIGNCAFAGCTSLTSVTIPNSVTMIGDYTFYNCSSLTSVTIPNSVTSIGNEAFKGCTKLTLVTLENYFTNYQSTSFPSSAKIVYANPITVSIVDKKIYSVTAVMSIPSIYDGYDEIGLSDDESSASNHYAVDANGKIEFADMPLNYSGTYYIYAKKGTKYVYKDAIQVSTALPTLSCSSSSTLTSITFSNISASTDETVQTLTKGVKFNGQYYEADENNTVTLSNLQLGRSYTIYLYGCYNGNYYEQSKTVSTKTPSLSCSVNSQHFAITLFNISASTDETVQTLTKGVKFNGQYYEADENNTVTLSNLQLGRSYTIYLYGCYNGNYYEQSKTVSTKTPSLSCSLSSTQTTITLSNIYASSDTSVHSLSKGIYYNYKRYEADKNDKVVITGIVPNTKCTLQVYGCYNGQYYYGDSKYVTTQAIAPILSVTESPTCVYAKGSYTHGDATILGTFVACTTTGSSVAGDEGLMTGLKPNTDYSFTYFVYTKEGGEVTATKTITTPALTLTTLTPKVVSAGNVVVAASTNISDLETNVGFEWHKYNAPPELPSSRAQAILYNGQMEGILHNLSLEYWKVRAYYEAADGTCYYGEWATFDPSQPAFFEPTVHTYALVTDPTANKVQMRGYVMTGTDDVTEQGFEYWFKGAKAPRRVASATPDSIYCVQASGQVMTAVLEDLAYSTTYTCRAYAVAGGKTYYGEEVQFLTPEDPRPIYTLYVMAGENGSVNTDVSGQYREGEIVTLTATPMAGYHFLQWSDGNTDNPRQLTIMADTELVALFELADGLEQLIIDNAQGTVRKFIHNNQLFIFHNGNLYTATGARVK